MFIVFEGIDNCGKSTLSYQFVQYLNDEFRDEHGILKVDPHLGDFIWTKEPTFTTEEADKLNEMTGDDQYRRERIFFESRVRHQDLMAGKNVVCDRYIWSGISYAYKFSPGCYEFSKELYLSENLFMQPDLYIFVDTPVEVCYDRDPEVGLERLKNLRAAYLKTWDCLKTPVLTIQSIGGEKKALNSLVKVFLDFVHKNELGADVPQW